MAAFRLAMLASSASMRRWVARSVVVEAVGATMVGGKGADGEAGGVFSLYPGVPGVFALVSGLVGFVLDAFLLVSVVRAIVVVVLLAGGNRQSRGAALGAARAELRVVVIY